MPGKLKSDVLQAIETWKAGKPVRSIELGHVHRMIEHPGMSPSIDTEARVDRDQERAYSYCFYLLELFQISVPPTFEAFEQSCKEYREGFEGEGLTEEERIAAESLVWKVLLIGWKKATAGHPESEYIQVWQHK